MGVFDGLASGAASLLGGVASSLIGANNQEKVNRQNRELFERSLAWQEDMFNKANAYNDPSNQVSRLLKAGINPSFVLGNGSMAEAGSMSAPSAPTMQAFDYSHLGSAVANGVNTYFNAQIANSQAKKNISEASKMDLETMQLEKELPSMIEYWQNKAKGEGASADIARNQLYFLQAVQGQRISQVFGDTRLQQQQLKQANLQMVGQDLDNQLKQVQLAYAPDLNKAQLAQFNATLAQIRSVISLNLANAGLAGSQSQYYGQLSQSEAVKRIGQIIDNGMRGFDFKFKQQTWKTSVDLLNQQYQSGQVDLFNRKENQGYESFTSFTPWLKLQRGYLNHPNR